MLASFFLGMVTDKNILLASILMLAMIPMEMIDDKWSILTSRSQKDAAGSQRKNSEKRNVFYLLAALGNNRIINDKISFFHRVPLKYEHI